jgi:hypothetical protein
VRTRGFGKLSLPQDGAERITAWPLAPCGMCVADIVPVALKPAELLQTGDLMAPVRTHSSVWDRTLL